MYKSSEIRRQSLVGLLSWPWRGYFSGAARHENHSFESLQPLMFIHCLKWSLAP